MAALRIVVMSNLCPPDFDGGLEMSALQMATGLRERGHDVHFVTSVYRDSFDGDKSDPEWVHRILEYVEPGEGGAARFAQFLKVLPVSLENAGKVEAFLAKNSFDVGYLFGLHRIGLASHIPMVVRNIPVLWHLGDTFLAKQLVSWPRKAPPYAWLLKTVFKEARELELRGDYDNIAFVSEHLRDYYYASGLKPKNSYVIPRGVDFELGTDLDRERIQPPLFFAASRLHEQKGLHHAIEAAALLSKRRPDLKWQLEIAGREEQPNYAARLEELIQRLNIKDRARLVGQLDRSETLRKIRGAAAILSTPTYEEPFGRTILEALASGTPLIASEVGAINEIVSANESALLYPRGDVGALSERMEQVLSEPELHRKLAEGGLKRVQENYTMDAVLDRVEAVLNQVIQGRKELECA